MAYAEAIAFPKFPIAKTQEIKASQPSPRRFSFVNHPHAKKVERDARWKNNRKFICWWYAEYTRRYTVLKKV
jgi:hypothetical protein